METGYARSHTDFECRDAAREKPIPARSAVEPPEASRPRLARLVAVTATGPVYSVESEMDLVPIPVGLAFLQELALRALYPEARVVSTLAGDVSGEEALAAWSAACGAATMALIGAAPADRLAFLGQVLAYVRRQGYANGIEPVLGAAVNAAWPWIEPRGLERILATVTRSLRESEFARAVAIPVLDPGNRTVRLFAPGGLAEYDPSAWLDRHYLEFYAPTGIHSKLSRFGAEDQALLDRLLGSAGLGKGRMDDLPGSSGGDPLADAAGRLLGNGLLGKLAGRLGGLPGGGGDDPLGDLAGGLLGGSPLGKQAGRFGGLPGQQGKDPLGDAFGGKLAGSGLDLSNIGGNGGPLGFGANLGPGGAAGDWESQKDRGHAHQNLGILYMGVGGALVGLGPATGGISIAVGISFGLIGYATKTLGDMEVSDADKQAKDVEKKEQADKDAKATADKAAADKAAEEKAKKDREEAEKKGQPGPKKKTGEKHLYPDPDGGGGTGDPTQLPDSDGKGGGKPNTVFAGLVSGNPAALWDENGGGGTPTTIWDKEGSGGGTPTTAGRSLTVPMLAGPGLLAGIVQVGPATFAL
jgi:hypothetical protein